MNDAERISAIRARRADRNLRRLLCGFLIAGGQLIAVPVVIPIGLALIVGRQRGVRWLREKLLGLTRGS